MTTLLAAAALLTLAQAQAESPDCEAPQYQLEMNACAGIDFERADAELNAVWRQVVEAARANDRALRAGGGSLDRLGYEATLREAQRAWLAFRDAHCTYHGYEARDGSMEPMLFNGCRAGVTRERTEQLRSLLFQQ